MTGHRPAVRVLVIEDDDLDYELTQQAAESVGLATRMSRVRSGEEGLELFESGTAEADLVLCDLRLGGIDAPELIASIRQNPDVPRLPVLVLSNSSSPMDIARCYEAGATAYMIKPGTFSQLEELFRRIAAFWGSFVVFPER